MRSILLLLTLLLLAGCASPDFNYLPHTEFKGHPPVENISKAYVGEVMLKQGKYKEHEALYLPQKVDVSWAYELLPGYYLKKGEDKHTETYQPSGGEESGAVKKANLAYPWNSVIAYKKEKTLCIVTVFNALICEEIESFAREKKPILTEDSLQKTLIYSGKIGNKVNIDYREFLKNLERPVFSNDVVYDLNASKIIAYKGARLKILEATNQYIKYKVISNFQ